MLCVFEIFVVFGWAFVPSGFLYPLVWSMDNDFDVPLYHRVLLAAVNRAFVICLRGKMLHPQKHILTL